MRIPRSLWELAEYSQGLVLVTGPAGCGKTTTLAAFVDRINRSGAGLVFVGLGCPKQDLFAYEHRHAIKAVQVCVGAAFDFHAGSFFHSERRNGLRRASCASLGRMGARPG